LLSIAIRQGARAVELQLHTDAMTTRDAVSNSSLCNIVFYMHVGLIVAL